VKEATNSKEEAQHKAELIDLSEWYESTPTFFIYEVELQANSE